MILPVKGGEVVASHGVSWPFRLSYPFLQNSVPDEISAALF